MVSRTSRLTCLSSAVLLLALISALSATHQAAADNALVSSVPGRGSVLAELPATVALTFAEPLDPRATTITVKDPDLRTVSTAITVDGPTATVAVTPGPDGRYRINFRVNSADLHLTVGSVGFTVDSGAPATHTVPPARPVTTAAPSATHGTPWWVWLTAAAVTLLAVAAAVLAVRRDRDRVSSGGREASGPPG